MTDFRLSDLEDARTLTQRMQRGGLGLKAAGDKAENFAWCAGIGPAGGTAVTFTSEKAAVAW